MSVSSVLFNVILVENLGLKSKHKLTSNTVLSVTGTGFIAVSNERKWLVQQRMGLVGRKHIPGHYYISRALQPVRISCTLTLRLQN